MMESDRLYRLVKVVIIDYIYNIWIRNQNIKLIQKKRYMLWLKVLGFTATYSEEATGEFISWLQGSGLKVLGFTATYSEEATGEFVSWLQDMTGERKTLKDARQLDSTVRK